MHLWSAGESKADAMLQAHAPVRAPGDRGAGFRDTTPARQSGKPVGRPGKPVGRLGPRPYRECANLDKDVDPVEPPRRPLCRTIFGCLRTVRGEPGTPSAARASSVPAWEALPPGPSGVRRRAQPTTDVHGAWRAAQRPAREWRALHTPVRARPRPADAHGDAAHGGVAPPGTLRDRAAPTVAWQRPQQRGQQWAAPPKPLGVLRTPPARAGGPAVRRLPRRVGRWPPPRGRCKRRPQQTNQLSCPSGQRRRLRC